MRATIWFEECFPGKTATTIHAASPIIPDQVSALKRPGPVQVTDLKLIMTILKHIEGTKTFQPTCFVELLLLFEFEAIHHAGRLI